jgi:RNA polymerase sigma factor (sigma-70 family)
MKIKTVSDEDLRLLEGIIKADKIQLVKIYNDFLPEVVYYVKKNKGTEDEAKDVFQDAIIILHKKAKEGLALQVALKSYFFSVCRNLWLMQLRKKKRLTVLDDVELQENEPDLFNKMEQTQQENIFYKYYQQLPEQCRKILNLFFSKVPMKTIAEEMATSESYIKKRKHVCKEKLVSAIKNDPLYKEMNDHG